MDLKVFNFLQSKLFEYPQKDYPITSRVHRLRSFPEGFFVKRDDELGFGISGCKFRKYRTLIPYILQKGFKEVLVIGGAFSNHVLSITQLLIEEGLQPTLFLKGPRPQASQGNFLFLETLLPSSSMKWISKTDWLNIERIVEEYQQSHHNSIIIPEGAFLFPAFLGALSLPMDIIRNEKQLGLSFDHVVMEVGTGLSAAALLLGMTLLKKECKCHFLHLADNEESFIKRVQQLQSDFKKWVGEDFSSHLSSISSFASIYPTNAASFGATNRTIFNFISHIAKNEGVLLDPIYSAKLFYEIKNQIAHNSEIRGNVLIIHSGGALTLSGFEKQLSHANVVL